MSPHPTSIYTQDPGPSSARVLGIEPILLRRIVHLGWPVIIGMLSQTAINIVDMFFIGRLPSEIAVSGTSAIFSSVILIWIFGGFLSAISVGTQAISARRFSEGNLEAAGKVLTNSLAVALVSSFAMLVCVYPLAGFLMRLVSPLPHVQEIGESYLSIRFLALAGMSTMAAYKSFYDGLGRVRIHMTIAMAMNVLNLLLCYPLIFGIELFGIKIPGMEVDGAAWAAILSSYFGLALMIFWSVRREDRQAFSVYRFANLDRTVAWAVVKLSVWSGLATVVLMAGVGLFNKIVGELDRIQNLPSVNSAAASIIIHIMLVVFMGSLAFGTSTATLVSQSVAARQFNLAERYGYQSTLIAIYFMSLFGLVVFFFPEPFLRVFMPHDVSDQGIKDLVVEHALPSMRIAVSMLSPIAAAAMVLTQALYGAGKTRYVLIVEFLLHFGVLVPGAYVLAIPLGMGLLGCWIAGILYAVGLLIATGIAFARGSWKETVL